MGPSLVHGTSTPPPPRRLRSEYNVHSCVVEARPLPIGGGNAETTPAGAPAAAADRKQRTDAAHKGKNG